MTVLDPSAVVAFLTDEAGADEAETLITRDDCVMTTIGIAEVIDHLVRVGGWSGRVALLDLADLGLAPPVELDTAAAEAAALLRARHYHRKTRTVSIADCVTAHAAQRSNTPLATTDPHLLDLCHEEGIAVIPLPDSKGNVWSPG